MFTDWMSDPAIQYAYGWIMIAELYFFLLINCIIIILDAFRIIKCLIIRNCIIAENMIVRFYTLFLQRIGKTQPETQILNVCEPNKRSS